MLTLKQETSLHYILLSTPLILIPFICVKTHMCHNGNDPTLPNHGLQSFNSFTANYDQESI